MPWCCDILSLLYVSLVTRTTLYVVYLNIVLILYQYLIPYRLYYARWYDLCYVLIVCYSRMLHSSSY